MTYAIGKDIASIELRLRRLEEVVYGMQEPEETQEENDKDDKEAAD